MTSAWRQFFDEDFLSRLERLRLAAKHALRPLPGSRASRRLGDGLEFADHRAYAPGDDVRFIDWPYFARMERLLLRLVHEHSEAEVAILLDSSASMGSAQGKFDYARRAAAALAYVALGGHERVLLAPFNSALAAVVHAGRSREHIFPLLEALGELAPGGKTDLSAAVRELIAHCPRAGVVLLISDLLDCRGQLDDALARLRVAGRRTDVLHIVSPAEAAPRFEGPLLLEHAEDRSRLDIDASKELLAQYRLQWQQFMDGCRQACLAGGAIYQAAPTDMPIDRLVLVSLKQSGVLEG